jgi:hypothetical protein
MEHVEVKRIRTAFGEPVAKLLIEKKLEIEKYNPSGHFPITVGTHTVHASLIPPHPGVFLTT